ncbi:MAG: PQQ-binding-like beta-propeller repeat protein [Polyangiales bacterium]
MVLAIALVPGAPSARAEPVPIGRYVEIHVGVSHGHPYATSGGDARRTGRSRAHAPARAPKPVWQVTLPHTRLLPPAVLADGTLIVGSAGGVYALDPRSGEQRWFAAIGVVRFTPSVTPDGDLIAFAGDKLWRLIQGGLARELTLPMRPNGSPLVLDSGTLIVPGPSGRVMALSSDGSLLTTLSTLPQQAWLRFTSLVSGDAFLVGGPAPDVSLLSLRGEAERVIHLSQGLQTSPLVSDDETTFLLGERGTLFVVAPDGSVRVSLELGQGGGTDGPALGWDGALRVGLRYGEVACFAESGREIWRRGVEGPPGPMLIDADDTLLFVGPRGVLYAIDRDGDLRYREQLDLRGAGRPVLGADGTIYVVSRAGQVQAWR